MNTGALPKTVAGLPCLRLRSADGASALVSRWGAQLLSWQPAGADEQLFLSARAVLDGSAPIRGGVPIVFPQFAGYGPLAAHGFARHHPWSLCADSQGTDAVTLALHDDAPLRTLWPHAFACEFTVRVGGPSLTMELRVTNRGERSLSFQAALHTYLRVDALPAVRIEGLAGARYLDRTAGDRPQRQHEAELVIDGETDRIYPDAPGRVVAREPRGAIELVRSGGFTDLVVWNPGPARCARIADMEPHAWRRLLALEAARIARPALLKPLETWCGGQRLSFWAGTTYDDAGRR